MYSDSGLAQVQAAADCVPGPPQLSAERKVGRAVQLHRRRLKPLVGAARTARVDEVLGPLFHFTFHGKVTREVSGRIERMKAEKPDF